MSDQLITYLGNKRKLIGFIGNGVRKIKKRLGKDQIRAIDLFAGSGVVSRFLKRHCSYLVSNDIEKYAQVVNTCYLANPSEVPTERVHHYIDFINNWAPENPDPGFISDMYAPEDDQNIKKGERVFYTTRNAHFIDTARKIIDDFDSSIKPFLLAPLIYKASVHTNTSGVFKGFYKNSDTGKGQFGGNGRNALTRIKKDIYLDYPIFSNVECRHKVTREDANDLAKASESFDLAYIDPPYNQHPYGSNYFMLNLIANYDRPDKVSRVSGIPKDWNRSDYNKNNKIYEAMDDLVDSIDSKYVLISYNSEGFISNDEMINLLSKYGDVETVSRQYNAFRGSRNLDQRDLYVKEHLFLLEKS